MDTPAHPKFTLNLDTETRKRLDALGKATDRSTGSIVRLAVRGFLSAAEEAELLASQPPVLKNGRARKQPKVAALK